MALDTFSKFYYGLEVNEFNYTLAFNEGAGERIAEVDVGLYSAQELAIAVAQALNEAGTNEYSVAFNRATRIYTITCDVNFTILGLTGTDTGTSVLTTLGFPVADTSSALSHTGTTAAGSVYFPQFILQSYIPTQIWQKAAFAQVNKSASGRVQVQQFGTEKFMQCNLKWITEIPQGDGGPIRTNPNGVDDVVTFLTWLSRKAPIEFMEDENDPEEYETMILESSPENNDGTGFKLKELYDQGLPYYFETGILKFRRLE
jgi:hypothetical protein